MPNLFKVSGFREATDDFFNTLKLSTPSRKENTPFIFYKHNSVVCIESIDELFEMCNDDDIILKTWVGRYRSDVFSFTVGSLKLIMDKCEFTIDEANSLKNIILYLGVKGGFKHLSYEYTHKDGHGCNCGIGNGFRQEAMSKVEFFESIGKEVEKRYENK